MRQQRRDFSYQQEDPAGQGDAPGDTRKGLMHRQRHMFEHCRRSGSQLARQSEWFGQSSRTRIADLDFAGYDTRLVGLSTSA